MVSEVEEVHNKRLQIPFITEKKNKKNCTDESCTRTCIKQAKRYDFMLTLYSAVF